jgi:hypothetical protein
LDDLGIVEKIELRQAHQHRLSIAQLTRHPTPDTPASTLAF